MCARLYLISPGADDITRKSLHTVDVKSGFAVRSFVRTTYSDHRDTLYILYIARAFLPRAETEINISQLADLGGTRTFYRSIVITTTTAVIRKKAWPRRISVRARFVSSRALASRDIRDINKRASPFVLAPRRL